jgi:hypothetical protein
LCTSPSIIRIIKSRRIRTAGHVARMGKKNACRMLKGKPEGKSPVGRPRYRWVVLSGLILLRIVTVEVFCEDSNEPSDSIQC